MAYTRAEWNRLQRNLPQEDRMSYEEYLASQAPAAPAEPVPPVEPPAATLTKADLDKALADALAVERERARLEREADRTEYQRMLTESRRANQALLDQQAAQQRAQQESQRRSAYEVMRERFSSYGLTSLADELTLILKGEGVTRTGQKITDIPTTSNGFYLALQETKGYYERFGIVNEQRIKEGFTALDEKTILGLEDQYQEVMKAYNAPAGFYDKPEDFRIFLRYNKSKAEVADTMQAFSDFVQSTDTTARQQLKDFYGIDDAALTAYFADPEKGQPLIEAIAARNLNTAAALASGVSEQVARLAAGMGAADLTYLQQRQKYGNIAREIEFGKRAAEIYGVEYSPEQAIAAEFATDQKALASQRRARRREIGEFQAQTGVGTTTLGRGTTAGLI